MTATNSALSWLIHRPTRKEVPEVLHYLKSHAIVHGYTLGKPKPGSTKRPKYPQVVARFLINPDEPNVPHIHFYTRNNETRRRIMRMFSVAWQPWNKDNPRSRMSTYSYGVREWFFNEPVFSPTFGIKLTKWQGDSTSAHAGPYWYKKTEEPVKPVVWIQGRQEEPGDVSDIQVDTVPKDLSYVEKTYLMKEAQEWTAKVRAGLPTITE